MARRIRSGTLVGPGTNRKLRPGITRVLKRGEKQSENRRLSLKLLGLRYSATPAPQPHGWVGASPPNLSGATALPRTRRNHYSPSPPPRHPRAARNDSP